jgi:hypothetical protein
MYPKKQNLSKKQKKIIEKEALVGRITKVFIPISKNFPISLSTPPKVLKKKQWSGGSQKFLYPNPKISQSFFQKNNKNLSKKNLWQGESQKIYTLINFSCSAQCFKQLHRL